MLGAGCDDVAEAGAVLRTVLAHVKGSDWTAPTPCPAWSVLELLNHVVATMTKFSEFADGLTDAPRTPSGDRLLGDAAGAFDAAQARAVRSWASVDPARRCRLPFGSFSAPQTAAVASFDVLVHAWDLAQAVGAPIGPPSARLLAVTTSVAEHLVTAAAVAEGYYARPEPTLDVPGWGALLWRTGRHLTRRE